MKNNSKIQVKRFETPADFFQANEYIFTRHMENYHLIDLYKRFVDNERIEVFSASNITDGKGNIYSINIPGNYLIYGFDWTPKMVEILSAEINLTLFKNWHFLGNKRLILELFKINSNINYSIFKDRTCYELDHVNNNLRLSPGSAVISDKNDHYYIGQYTYEYGLEEWGIRENRGLEFCRNLALSSINSGSSVHWGLNNQITSIAQLIDLDCEIPIIGSLYTPPQFRGNGYASSLVYEAAKQIIEGGYDKCGIISDAYNLTTNKMFKKIGFKAVFDHIDILI